MPLKWKGPDGSGYLYSDYTEEAGQYNIAVPGRGMHPGPKFKLLCGDGEIGEFPSDSAAKAAAEKHLSERRKR